MAATNRLTFTITQPFLGSPLQFQPALGSEELEALVDAYVIGNGSKQEKLSVVTVEFFNQATVDLNTGALFKTYEVFPFGPMSDSFFEQSPVESQSSGFSPPIFTPSPGSSATFGDSGYGSFSLPSMTPPRRTLGSTRVSKKPAKKEVKKPKVDEARLPGFSIMTKDGIDVTTTAGRGTKTKEQREHAHLMRIMKACDACKRKKIRCDPSHRRSQNDMSRTSTTTTQSSSASARPSPQYESSPGSSAPALSRQSTQASQRVFTPSNVVDDFVLFPEDSASWNPELSQTDLDNFNFDINDIDFNELPVPNNDFSIYQQPYNDFNFDPQVEHSFYQQPQSYSQLGGVQNYSSTPLMPDTFATPDSYDLEQNIPVSHTRPHPSNSTQDSGQIDSSPRGWSDISRDPPTNYNGPLSSTSDWNILESTLISDSPGDLHDRTSSSGLAFSSLERVSSDRSPLSSSRSRTSNTQGFTATLSSGNNRTAANAASSCLDSIAQRRATALNERQNISAVGHESSAGMPVNPSDILDVPLLASRQRPSPAASSAVLRGLSENCQQVSQSLQTINSTRSEYTGLGKDLQRLSSVADALASREIAVPGSVLVGAEQFESRLNALSARLSSTISTGTSNPLLETLDPEFDAEYLRQCQVEARRLVRSLCATINTIQAQNVGTQDARNMQTLTSGRNSQIFPPPSRGSPQTSLISGLGMWTQSTHDWQTNNGQSANVLREADTFKALESVSEFNELYLSPMSESESGTLRLSRMSNVPRYLVMVKDAQRLDVQSTVNTSAQDVSSVLLARTTEDRSSLVASSRSSSQRIDVAVADNNQTSPTTQYVDSSQETSLAQARLDPSRSAILQTTATSQEASVSLSISAPLSFVFTIAILGSLFICSKIIASFMTSPLAVLGLQALASVRERSTEWIGNDSFSVAKLILCAAMTAQLPALTKSALLCGGMTLFPLLTGAEMSNGKERTSMSTSSRDMDFEERCGDKRGLMTMMMDFSPLVAVQ